MVRSISRVFLVAVVWGIAGCGATPVAPVGDQPAWQDVNVNMECRSDADCDDGRFCNGVEHCWGGACVAGSIPCSTTACDEQGNRCLAPVPPQPEPECRSDNDCDDGRYCNGVEHCRGGVCVAGSNPCSTTACDEQGNRCQASSPPPPEQPIGIALRVPIGVFSTIPIANMDALRAACLFLGDGTPDAALTDAEIIDSLIQIDGDWLAGFTYLEEYDYYLTETTCGTIPDCRSCLGTQIDFVYLVAHSTPPPPAPVPPTPPPFVAGNVFSFLTPAETELFLSLVASSNRAIDEQVDNQLSADRTDLISRGLSCSSLFCTAECSAETNRIQQKRDATGSAIDQAIASGGRAVTPEPSDFLEINDFNCREYPNRSFVCDLTPCGLSSITCTINRDPCH